MAAEYKRSSRKKLSIEQLQDVQVPVSLELGKKRMTIRELVDMTPGMIVKLERLAGEPIDLIINGKAMAKGEVAVMGNNFSVRVITLLSPEERAKLL